LGIRSIKRETTAWATSTHALHELPACDDPEGQLEPFQYTIRGRKNDEVDPTYTPRNDAWGKYNGNTDEKYPNRKYTPEQTKIAKSMKDILQTKTMVKKTMVKMTTMKKVKNMNLEMKEEMTMVKITKTKIRVKMEKETRRTTTHAAPKTILHMMMENLPILEQEKRKTRHITHMSRGG